VQKDRIDLDAEAPSGPRSFGKEFFSVLECNGEGKQAIDRRLTLLHSPLSPQAAAYRALRDTISSKQNSHVIAVACGASGDGATSCAVNLGLAFAELESERVLLVDVSDKNPALVRVFGLGPRHRDSTCHAHDDSLFVVHSVANRVWVAIPRMSLAQHQGILDERSVRHLISEAMRVGCTRVVFDTSAVGNSCVSDIVLRSCEGVVVAVRAGKTRGPDVARLQEIVEPERVLGAVLVDA